MGTNFNPSTVSSGFRDVDLVNQILSAIRDDLNNKVDRTGLAPNAMEANLDMGSNRLLNVAQGVLGTDGINLNQLQSIATQIALTVLGTGGSGQDQTTGDPITFNFGVASGLQGASTRTVFDLEALFGVTSFLGLTVVVNGVVQIPGLAYSVTGQTVTFTESLDTDSDIMFIYGDLSPVPILSLTINNYDFGVYVEGTPDSQQLLINYIVPRRVFFVEDFIESFAKSRVAATAETVFSIQVEGVEVGTITFAAASDEGVFSSASDITVEIGETISVQAPVSVDNTLTDVTITLKGSRL